MIQLTQAHILGAIIAFLLGVFIIPIVIYFSDKAGLVDVPNERKIHKGKISRLGGIAIWTAVMLTFFVPCFIKLLSERSGFIGNYRGRLFDVFIGFD